MPVEFTINHDKRYVEARAVGETTREDIENFLDAVVVQGALPAVRRPAGDSQI